MCKFNVYHFVLGLALAFVLLLVSCNDRSTSQILRKAAQLMDEHPDSAIRCLTALKGTKHLSSQNEAKWSLIYSYSLYKIKRDIRSDSLLQTAQNYFDKNEDNYYCGLLWYLYGSYYRCHDEPDKAMSSLKRAGYYLRKTHANQKTGLVEFSEGYILSQDELYKHALGHYRESLKQFMIAQDLQHIAYCYREIGNMYYELDYPMDSILFNFNRSIELSQHTGDSINLYSSMLRKGVLLCDRNNKEAKLLIQKGMHYFPDQRKYYRAYLAYICSKLNQNDSARFYLKECIAGNDKSMYRIIGLHAAALVEHNSQNFNKAFHYLDESYNLRDSNFQQTIQSQLYRIDKQYDLTNELSINSELTASNHNRMFLITFLSGVVLVAVQAVIYLQSSNRKRKAKYELEKQRLEFDKETIRLTNLQKQDIIKVRLIESINNTLELNRLKKSFMQPGKQQKFNEQLAQQSILTEGVWDHYIKQVDLMFDNRLTDLKTNYIELTPIDMIVIALISLHVKIQDACTLLNMTKNTMYVRRKTIKKRLMLDIETDLEKWICDFVGKSI